VTDESGPVARVLDASVVAVFGAIADVAAVVVLLNVDGVQQWVGQHSEIMTMAVALFIWLTVVFFNANVRLRKNGIRERDALASTVSELSRKPSSADVARFKAFIRDLGPNSQLYSWLKHGFIAKTATGAQIDMVSTLCEKWERDPSTYVDVELAQAFDSLRQALNDLQDLMLGKLFPPKGHQFVEESKVRYSIPSDWEHLLYEEALGQMRDAYKKVMAGYDRFYVMANDRALGFGG
jgi:hypothetical protein